MEHVPARWNNLALDSKRIAATSVAIAVHGAVLMLLMLPSQQAAAPMQRFDTPLEVVVPKLERLIPPPIDKPVPLLRDEHPVTQIRVETPTPPVDTTVAAIDPYVGPVVEDPITNSFEAFAEAPPAFAQIVADVSPTPPYPAQALHRRLQGVVTLLVVVDAQGQPVQASIASSSGSKLLDEAARKFVMARWHFIPAMQGGVPVQAEALVPIDFVLSR